ncbi:hypothetical protein PR048_019428 [Dryococelus australis]|uniref:MADF domain-containing protein n=1 Tax=Dryococelus australis TaxID=614101 RepID=A0ABQ9H3H1_9NEOP|nr:hypothetical protein PR048_019428 [Dryococelus australis]
MKWQHSMVQHIAACLRGVEKFGWFLTSRSREPKRVMRGEYGAALECKSGGKGGPREKNREKTFFLCPYAAKTPLISKGMQHVVSWRRRPSRLNFANERGNGGGGLEINLRPSCPGQLSGPYTVSPVRNIDSVWMDVRRTSISVNACTIELPRAQLRRNHTRKKNTAPDGAATCSTLAGQAPHRHLPYIQTRLVRLGSDWLGSARLETDLSAKIRTHVIYGCPRTTSAGLGILPAAPIGAVEQKLWFCVCVYRAAKLYGRRLGRGPTSVVLLHTTHIKVNTLQLQAVHGGLSTFEAIKQPPLHDVQSKDYSNKQLKATCWNEVGEAMYDTWNEISPIEKGVADKIHCFERLLPSKELMKKWKTLRDNFVRDFSLLKKSERGMSATKKKYVYYDQLSFLVPHVKGCDNTASNIPPPEEQPAPNDQAVNVSTNNAAHAIVQQHNPTPLSSAMDREQWQEMTKKRPAIGRALASASKSITEIMQESVELQRGGNSSDKFGNKAFLLSFVPIMDNVPPQVAFDVRMQITEIFRNAVLHATNTYTPSRPSQPPFPTSRSSVSSSVAFSTDLDRAGASRVHDHVHSSDEHDVSQLSTESNEQHTLSSRHYKHSYSMTLTNTCYTRSLSDLFIDSQHAVMKYGSERVKKTGASPKCYEVIITPYIIGFGA